MNCDGCLVFWNWIHAALELLSSELWLQIFLTLHFTCIVTGNPPRPVRQTLVGCIVQAFHLFVGFSPGRSCSPTRTVWGITASEGMTWSHALTKQCIEWILNCKFNGVQSGNAISAQHGVYLFSLSTNTMWENNGQISIIKIRYKSYHPWMRKIKKCNQSHK